MALEELALFLICRPVLVVSCELQSRVTLFTGRAQIVAVPASQPCIRQGNQPSVMIPICRKIVSANLLFWRPNKVNTGQQGSSPDD